MESAHDRIKPEENREFERIRAHEDIHSLNLELSALLEMNHAIGRHLDRDELFGALAGSLKTLIPTERFG